MSEVKTKPSNVSVSSHLNQIEDESRRKEAKTLLKLFTFVTGLKAKMWGPTIVGFGSYHYIYNSGREGDWPRTGFSVRKGNFSIYIMNGFDDLDKELAKLGPHKVAKSCLYLKTLATVDLKVLEKIVKKSLKVMEKRYPS